MKKDTIVQYVCFVTNLGLDEFVPLWERYAKKLSNKKNEHGLQQHVAETKNKFRYISQHEWPDRDVHFSFMNEKRSEHFPEHNVKVVQVGGYLPLEIKRKHNEGDGEIKLIAFISHDENDLDFYRGLPLYTHLNILEAYYQSCSYGYVIEFFVPESDADELIQQLKQRSGVETGVYKECLAQHA